MSGQILLFPATKRIGTIRRWAYTIARYRKVKSRENTIRLRVETHAEGLRRIGIEEDVITRETNSVETALRAQNQSLPIQTYGRHS